MEHFKEVTIECGSKTKFLTINFISYNETMDMIRRKFDIPGGFELKVISDHGKGREMSIDDDDDLYRFKDSKEFIVRLLDEPERRDLTSQLGRPEAAACTPPPSYEQSVHTAEVRQTTAGQSSQRKVPVVWDGTRKLVNFDMNSLANAKASIRTKFNIVGDFDILGKLPGDERHYDIHADGDLDDLKNAESFLVKRLLNKEKQSDRSDQSKKQGKMYVVSDGERQKMVKIDFNSLINTKTAIRTKFNLFGDFDLLGKLPGNEHPFDIQNDDDLDDCREAESFLLKKRLNEGRQSDESSNSKVTLKMKFEAQDEFVSIDLECLRSTRNAISQKFNIFNGDFQLLVKKNGVGKYIDVDDDDVLATLTKDDVLLVERTAQPSTPMEEDPTSSQQQDAPECKALVEVKIGKTMYPVNEAPPGNSLVVRKETADLKLDFDLYGVIKKTDVVADCLRIARYGVANNPNLSSSMGDIVSGVMEITQKTKHAVMKFRMKGGEVLDDLVSGVGFLMEHVDSVAMTKFKRIKGNTTLLKDQSKQIMQEVDNRREAINGVLAKVKQETKEHAAKKKETYEEIQKSGVKELERRVAVAKKDTESSDARIKMHEKEIETDRERVKKALDKEKGCGYNCTYGLCHHGWCTCLPLTYSECCYRCCPGGWRCHHRNRRYYWYWRHLYCHDHGHGVDEKRVKAEQALQLKAEEDRQKEIAERNKLREEEKKAIGELQNYINDMKLKGDQLPADFTEKALHATDGALRALNASVQSTVHFWDKMNQHCEAMGNTAAIADNVDNIKDDLVQRERYLNTPMFKSEAVRLYAKWVALRHLCEEFDTQMKPVETSIQRSILDYPDPEVARRKIPELISALDTKLLLQKEKLAQAAADNESIMEGE